MNHDQLKELLPLEAMGRLEGEEARAMAAHLREGCDECAAELCAFREVLAAMALADVGDGPADRIWARLEQRLAPPGAIAADRPATPGADRAVRGVSRGWRVATVAAAAAAAMLAVVAGNFANQLAATQHDAATQTAALDERLLTLSHQLADRDREVIALRNQATVNGQLAHALLAPDLRTIKLGPLPPAPDAGGLVITSASRGQSLLQVAGLPPAPADKTYELWWIGARSGPVRAAIFVPGANGGAFVTATMPPAGEPILASAITLEPAGGVAKPTGAMYLKGAP